MGEVISGDPTQLQATQLEDSMRLVDAAAEHFSTIDNLTVISPQRRHLSEVDRSVLTMINDSREAVQAILGALTKLGAGDSSGVEVLRQIVGGGEDDIERAIGQTGHTRR